MKLVVPRDDLLGADRQRAPAIVADEAARLAHQQAARGGVPRLQVAFPESVVPPGSDPREIERGGAEAANAGDLRADGTEDSRPFGEVAVRLVRNAGRDQRLAELAAP